jgi:hypothetical protein
MDSMFKRLTGRFDYDGRALEESYLCFEDVVVSSYWPLPTTLILPRFFSAIPASKTRMVFICGPAEIGSKKAYPPRDSGPCFLMKNTVSMSRTSVCRSDWPQPVTGSPISHMLRAKVQLTVAHSGVTFN